MHSKLDLLKIFGTIEESYAIIKLPKEFPKYQVGSDLDIFCLDIQKMTSHILSFLNDYNIRITKNINQIYIDVLDGDAIYFRFDLYQALPNYNNISIKEGFFSTVVESAKSIEIAGYKIMVPSDIDEIVLRYIEYQEWYALRPDKIKHIEYIEDKIKKNNINKELFLDKLHYYTTLPKVQVDIKSKTGKYSYIQDKSKKVFRYLKQYGLQKTVSKIISRIFR